MKNFLILSFILTQTFMGEAQCGQDQGTMRFEGVPNLKGHTLIPISTGGFMMASIGTNGASGIDWIVSRLNNDYSIVWTKAMGNASENTGDNLLLLETDDDNFIIAGHQMTGTSLRVLNFSKFDGNGNIIWTKRTMSSTNPGETAADILQVAANRYLIVGTSNTFSTGSSDGMAFVFDNNGTIIWANHYGNGPNEHFYSCSLLQNGNILCTGEADGLAWLVTLNQNGNLLSSQTISNIGSSMIMDCKLDNIGNIHFTGMQNSASALLWLKTNINLNPIASKKITGFNTANVGSTIQIDGSSNIYISAVGSTSYANSGPAYMLKLDNNGEILNSNNLSTIDNSTILIRSQNLELINDLPVLISFNNASSTHLHLLNSCATNNCASNANALGVDQTVNLVDLNVTTTSFSSFTDNTYSASTVLLTTSIVCEPTCQIEINVQTDQISCVDQPFSITIESNNTNPIGLVNWSVNGEQYSSGITINYSANDVEPLQFFAEVFNFEGDCSITWDTTIVPIAPPEIIVPAEITLCALPSDSLGSFSQYEWSLSNGNSIIPLEVTTPGIYHIENNNECGIASMDINILLDSSYMPNLEDLYLCSDDEIIEIELPQDYTYLLNGVPTSTLIEIDSSGNYIIETTSPAGCVYQESFTAIDYSSMFDFTSIPDTIPQCDIQLFMNDYSIFEFQQNSFQEVSLVDSPGIYYLSPETPCMAQYHEVYISSGTADFSSLDSVYILCPGQIVELPYIISTGSVLLNDNFVSQPIIISNPGNYQLNTTDNICGEPFYIEVTLIDQTFTLPSSMCIEEAQETNFQLEFPWADWQYSQSENGNWIAHPGWNTVVVESACFDQQFDIYIYPQDACSCLAWVPNAFTPNNDYHNEIWGPNFSSPPIWFELSVYNRWGQVIHVIDNQSSNLWTGNFMTDGTYYNQNEVYNWVLKFQCFGDSEITYKNGIVVLIR